MKLTFLTRRYWPSVGGIESFVRHLARALANHHDVSVLAERIDDGPARRLDETLLRPPKFEAFDDGGVRVEQLRISGARLGLTVPLVHQVLPGFRRYAYGRIRPHAAGLYARVAAPLIAEAASGSDVIHIWAADMMAFAGVRAARTVGASSVITPFAHEGWWGDDPASAAAFRSADRVVGLLKADADVYRRLGVSPDRLAVSGVCANGAKLGGGPGLRQAFGINGPLILFLGVRRPYKGFSLLLEAAPLIAACHPGVTFGFVGPGQSIPDLPNVRVIDAGMVSDDERSAWLDAADLLCLPSNSEILPGSILEAWSVGTPSLVAAIPTLRELVETTGGGIAVERSVTSIASTIVELLDHPEHLKELGRAGREAWRSRYTVEAVTEWHESLYDELATRSTEPRRVSVVGA